MKTTNAEIFPNHDKYLNKNTTIYFLIICVCFMFQITIIDDCNKIKTRTVYNRAPLV